MSLAASFLVLFLAPGCGDESPAPGARATAYELKVYKVWASDGEEKPLPKDLEPIHKQLKKFSRKKSFRLDEKPFTATLRSEKPVVVKLPDGYEARWTLETGARGVVSIRQALVNPKKEESKYFLKKSPVLTEIRKLEKGGESFYLVVEFKPAEQAPEKRG
jgi:hypothetical protein